MLLQQEERRNHVVSLSKTHLLPTVLVKPRKHWLRPDMTEKLLAGTLNLNTNSILIYIKKVSYNMVYSCDMAHKSEI